MPRLLFATMLAAVAFGSTLTMGVSRSYATGRETLSPEEAARIGMVDAWQRKLTIPGGLSGIVNTALWVDQDAKKQFVELLADGKPAMRLSADAVDATGKTIGLDEAKRLALMETYKFKRRGMTTEIVVREVPNIRLYALGEDGTVECRDAEDGRLIWVERYGDPRVVCLPMAVSQNYVAFVNANQLIVLNAKDGSLVTQKKLASVPLNAPIIIGEYIMCFGTGGRVEGFWTSDFDEAPFTAHAAGLPLAGPVASVDAGRAMWPTDANYLYAIDGQGKPQFLFRVPTVGTVTAPLASSPGGRFFAATDRGQMYAIMATNIGEVIWRQSLDGAVYRSPVVLGDRVFASTVNGEMFGLNASTGEFLWPYPVRGVHKILGGTPEQVLVRTTSAYLQAVDSKSGNVVAELAGSAITDSIHNPWTDRLYLLTNAGTVQCLRPQGADFPTMMAAAYQPPSGNKLEEIATPEKPATDPGSNPFGGDAGGNDPFGGGAGNDPFGGGAGNDPFGGGGGGADPFGGSEDPFGG